MKILQFQKRHLNDNVPIQVIAKEILDSWLESGMQDYPPYNRQYAKDIPKEYQDSIMDAEYLISITDDGKNIPDYMANDLALALISYIKESFADKGITLEKKEVLPEYGRSAYICAESALQLAAKEK